MSYDLTLWHDPKLRSFDRAMARLGRRKPASARERSRLVALRDALLAGPLARENLSVAPEIDEDTATIGLALTGDRIEAIVQAMAPVLRAHGAVMYDPQDGTVTYSDRSSSRDAQNSGGVHEGVPICLAELTQQPPLPVATQVDALDALEQFVLADSSDVVAAARLALPVVDALRSSPEERVRHKAHNVAFEIRDALQARGLLDPTDR